MDLHLFKKKDFALVIIGNLVSRIGTYFQEFALSLYVLEITGSATKFASILTVTAIPQIILGPFMGVFADRFDRKKIIVYSDLLSGTIVGITALIFNINGEISMLYIYFLSIVLSIISLIFTPAIGGVIPSIIKEEKLLEANAINSFVSNFALVIAPIIAGVLYSTFGIFIIFVVNSISFIISAISEMFINIPKLKRNMGKLSVKSYFHDLAEGLKITVKVKAILSIMFLALIANFALNPITNVGFVYIVKQVFNCSSSQLGFFQGIMLLGMLIAPILSTTLLKGKSINKIISYNMLFSGVIIAISAFVASSYYTDLFSDNTVPYITLLILVVFIAVFISVINIFLATVFQKEVPLEMLGRVGAVLNTIGAAMTPLGQMFFGVLFDSKPVYFSFLLAAAIIVISTLIFNFINSRGGSGEEKPKEKNDMVG